MMDLDALEEHRHNFGTDEEVEVAITPLPEFRALIAELRAARKVVEAASQINSAIITHDAIDWGDRQDLRVAVAEYDSLVSISALMDTSNDAS